MMRGAAHGSWPGPYVGSRILGGNGICAVYSEDPRRDGDEQGVYHFYVDGYGDDYLRSCRPVFIVEGVPESASGSSRVRRDASEIEIAPDIFHTETRFTSQANPSLCISYGVFASPRSGGVVFDIAIRNIGSSAARFTIQPAAVFRAAPAAIARVDASGFTFAAANFPRVRVGLGLIGDSQSAAMQIDSAGRVTLAQKIVVAAGETARTRMVLAAWRKDEPITLDGRDASYDDALRSARNWLDGAQGIGISDPELRRAYGGALLALAATELKGAVPADMTGQFVTNDRPQLYPRDALMTARALLACGHADAAKRIISFWNASIPQKSPGEWYARYDADAAATAGGSGAPYDLPEWDSNGYYASLVLEYYIRTGEWIGDYDLMKKLLDFVCAKQDQRGLVEEGGIIEWVGRLPATNMNLAAGLRAGALIARMRNEPEVAAFYRRAAERMEAGLHRLFSERRGAYMDWRGPLGDEEKFNSSANFGFLWGYPDHFELAASNAWYRAHAVKLGGGVQYFEASGYGSDLFGFTTGAAAQYQLLAGDNALGLGHLRWMMDHSNIYGMMPERIFFPNGDGVSPASPLSWCNAEFAMALREGVLTASPGIAADAAPALSGVMDALTGARRILDATSGVAKRGELIARIDGGLAAACAEASIPDKALILHDLIAALESSGDVDLRYLTARLRMRFSRIIANISGATFTLAAPSATALHENLPIVLSGSVSSEVTVSGAKIEWSDGNGSAASDRIVLKKTSAGFSKSTTLAFRKGEPPYETAIRATLEAKWNGVPFTLARSAEVAILPRFEIRQHANDGAVEIDVAPHVDTSGVAPRVQAPRGWSVRSVGAWSFEARPDASVTPGFHKFVFIGGKKGEVAFEVAHAASIDLAGVWDFRTGDDTSWATDPADANAWSRIKVPAYWEDQGHTGYDGYAWYRREVEIPFAWKGHDVELELGAVDDVDWTYWNGALVGHKEIWNEERVYPIPQDRIRFGAPNVIAVRVLDHLFGGGIWSGPVVVRMKPPEPSRGR